MKATDIQQKYFSDIGLSYDNGKKILNDIYSVDLPTFEKTTSQHQILFASISINLKINNILEIGTLDGVNALFMSKLFKEAKITTLDLPDDDKTFTQTYNRENNDIRTKFISDRNKTLSLNKNIKFIQKNSINYLSSIKEKFDLIWVDGAHGAPDVVIDITNSLRVLNTNGYLVCDDIFIKEVKDDQIYKSTAGFKTLLSFVNAGIIKKFNLIIKKFNNNEKFIAVVDGKNVSL